MKFIVSKSGDEWKIKETEINTDIWKVNYLQLSDTYYVIVEIVVGSMQRPECYAQALLEGTRAIERNMTQWRKDFGQI